MSSGSDSINSGPLIVRLYNDGSINNTYLFNSFVYPVSSNYLLITSTNGLLAPSNSIYLSSLSVSSCNASTVIGSTVFINLITASTISTGNLFYSSLHANTIRVSTLQACTINLTNLTLSTSIN